MSHFSMKNSIHLFDSPQKTAVAVAEFIMVKAIEKTKLNKQLNIGLSGGNTPKLLFELLATQYKTKIPWQTIRIFWVDERCVPVNDSESNYGMTRDTLLNHISIPDENIFRIKGEENPHSEAVNYEKIMRLELPIVNSHPQLDVVLLGMGDDGHTASIFPNQMHLLSVMESVSVTTHPVSGQHRITLTGGAITNAPTVLFLITGKSKSTVWKQMFRQEPESDTFPAYHVHSLNGTALFFLDKEAASEL